MCCVVSLSDVDECADRPCRNNASCRDGDRDFTCVCQDGWKGRTCSSTTSHCDPSTCQNGGTCTDLGDGFACHCLPGWRGSICQIRE